MSSSTGSEPDNSNTAVLEPDQKKATKPRDSTKPRRQPPYNVVLLDDNDHTYEYVIEMVMGLFGYDKVKSFKLACEVDYVGRVVLLTTTKEHAEFKRDQIHAFGPDKRIERCAGAMSAIIEPAEET
jgi:ATP-dependent Clp protease adaptor protein ClpS